MVAKAKHHDQRTLVTMNAQHCGLRQSMMIGHSMLWSHSMMMGAQHDDKAQHDDGGTA